MILQILNLLGRNKSVDHPILGNVTCEGLRQAHDRCLNMNQANSFYEKQCRTLFQLCNKK